jgi:hypothetical protein
MVARGRRIALLAAAALVPAGGLLLGAGPARAADVFVEANPSTAEAGSLVGIRASCRKNDLPATVESPAFGAVTVQPQAGVLSAAAMVPGNARADTYRVKLSCPDGMTATTQLIVLGVTRPSRGPDTGFGGTAGQDPGDLLIAGGLGATLLGLALGFVTVRRRTGLLGRRYAAGSDADA